MTAVVWLSRHGIARGYWDQTLLEAAFDGDLWPHGLTFTHTTIDKADGGAVVVIPGRFHADDADWINEQLHPLTWALVIVTSDEESLFPQGAINHPNHIVWTMTPRPGHKGRSIGEGWQTGTRQHLSGSECPPKPLRWAFAGQVTHERRRACVEALEGTPGELHATESFAAGLDLDEYLNLLTRARFAPCPGGPATPDTFRAFEALEAGAVPILDDLPAAAGYPTGYWSTLFGDHPLPTITDWSTAPEVLERLDAEWPACANDAQAWWLDEKRRIVQRLTADLTSLGAIEPPAPPITVLMPTSVIPAHPSTAAIEATVASVRAQLPDVEIVVMADGVRAEQSDRAADYAEYMRRLLWLAHHHWSGVRVEIAPEHLHQGNVTRRALRSVTTPCVLFVEHDTPLCGDIDWRACTEAVTSGAANVIRFHHEAHVLEPHQHLMLDTVPQDVCGAPMLRTRQWSQRPHLASTSYYRDLIGRYFGSGSRTMIEDVMHGVVDQAAREHGEDGWRRHKLWMYAPPGDMKRSLHLDARGEDPKYDMVYAYDGPKPEGAPAPTAGRVD